MRVKPRPGVKVRNPVTKFHLAESGEIVPDDSYWLRRLADGDVIIVQSDSELSPEESPK